MDLTLFVLSFGLLILLGVPISFAMLASSVGYTLWIYPDQLISVPHKMLTGIDSFILLSIPFFLFVGQLMTVTNILARLLALSTFLVGRMAGGLAQVNIVVSMLFAGISGTATADTAAIGSMLIPSMIREKYDRAFSAAVTAASSTIGPVIPPSVIMVALGASVGVSVGGLFLGGVVPGVLVGLLMLFISYIISKRRGYGGIPAKWSFRALTKVVAEAAGPLAIPIIIIGGIVGGVFTPTEASDIAVVTIFVLGFLIYRNLTLRAVWKAVRGTIYLLGPVMLIVSAASVFGNLLIEQQVGSLIVKAMLSISKDPNVILLMISAVLLFLGLFLEALAIMFLVAPLLMPVVLAVGIDPIHFGVVMVLALMIGLITPPVGISMFISCTLAGVKVEDFTKAILPFFAVLILNLLICIFVPEVILYLPRLVMSQ